MKLIIATVLAVITILGAVTWVVTKNSPEPTPEPVSDQSQARAAASEASSTPTPLPSSTCSQKYSIAVIGDSMVDTMGETMEYLTEALAKKYPNCEFKLYNYGIGAQNIDQGLSRFNLPFTNKTRVYPSLPELKPDILIVASFSYNPQYPFDAETHKQKLVELAQAALKITPGVYLLSEIAPLGSDFGKGAAETATWDDKGRQEHALDIIALLNNVPTVGKNLKIPVINTYAKTRAPGSKFGQAIYINPTDHIHPSDTGHILVANLIAETIVLK